MRWLVLNTIDDNLLPYGYQTSIKIAYVLNVTVVSVGIGEYLYNLEENAKSYTFEAKMRLLLELCAEEEQLRFADGIQKIKDFNKLKNKPSKLIGPIIKLKFLLINIYDGESEYFFKTLQINYELRTLKKILHPEQFYYYPKSAQPNEADLGNFTLELPDPENGIPIFFLTVQDYSNKDLLSFEIFKSTSKNAEELNNCYAEESCKFPIMALLVGNDLRNMRADLEKPSKEFREKIEAWAQVCYQNPNSKEGLLYFRKHLKKWLNSTKKLPLKSRMLKGIDNDINNLRSEILIGEMPIEKIWQLYLNGNTITQKSFDTLLQYKSDHTPKYDGRWPVVIFKCLDTNFKLLFPKDEIKEESTNLSVRKTISLD